ncbi:MAG: anti-sigma factor family protein [Chloroflexota bacterium]
MADAAERHDGHDPALVASLFDGDLGGGDLATAQLWVATCPACASLHADLLALSQATRAQPTPSRPRDYRLTPDDAARLRAEPADADARLTPVMNDVPAATAHSSHDETLVASLADHSLPATERQAGMDLVASCLDCAALHADLVALVAATRAMPTPPRPIDYTLTRGHAARLRPNPWRRLVAVVGSAHDGASRPLAMGFTALGLVGILVASAPTILQPASGAGSGAPASEVVGQSLPINAAAPAPGAVDTAGEAPGDAALASGAANAAAASSDPERAVASAPAFGAALPAQPGGSGAPIADGTTKGAAAGPGPTPGAEGSTTADVSTTSPPPGVNALLVVSTTFLVVGLGLFLLRWSARRLTDG